MSEPCPYCAKRPKGLGRRGNQLASCGELDCRRKQRAEAKALERGGADPATIRRRYRVLGAPGAPQARTEPVPDGPATPEEIKALAGAFYEPWIWDMLDMDERPWHDYDWTAWLARDIEARLAGGVQPHAELPARWAQ